MDQQNLKFHMRKVLQLFIVALLSSVLALGCAGESESDSSDDLPNLTPDNPDVGSVDINNFYVRLFDNGLYPFYIYNTTDGFGNNCYINSNDPGTDMTCMFEVLEGAIHMHGLYFQYNAPNQICDYVTMHPYFYWNEEIGYGPTAISIDIDEDAGTTSCDVTDEQGTINYPDCDITTERSEVVVDPATADATCRYDRTRVKNGVNCCFGDYILTKTVTSGGLTDPPVIQEREWGGDIFQCLGGLPRLSWDHFTDDGYPVGFIQSLAKGGVNKIFEVEGLRGRNIGNRNTNLDVTYTNLPIANYANLGGTHNHDGYYSATNSSFPYAIAPIDDRSGSLLFSTNPYYTWTCLDDGFEVKHRIRVIIREWNTLTDFLAFGTSSGVTIAPDVGDGIGADEGVNCSYFNSGDDCNDAADWKNMLEDNGGTWTTDTAADADFGVREFYFPLDVYARSGE